MASIESIVQTLGTLFAVPIMVRLMKLADVQLSIIGFIIMFTGFLIKGLWLNPMGKYFASIKVIGRKVSLSRDEIS